MTEKPSLRPIAISDTTETTLIGKTLYGYDDSDRLTSIYHKNASNTTLDSFTYTLDDDGFVTQETSTLGPTRNNTYDGNSQLISTARRDWSIPTRTKALAVKFNPATLA